MASHNDLGRQGEMLAGKYLAEMGLSVLHTNWKYPPYEIDLIASRVGRLHFIEVKTRTGAAFGYPEESVDRKKFRNLQKAAAQFLFRHPYWQEVQFDILSILLGRNRPPEYFYIEDVYL